MNWSQQLAGVDLRLGGKTRQRIGINGFGIDDTGVLEVVEEVVPILRLGSRISAFDQARLDAVLGLQHGSNKQAEEVEALCKTSLVRLKETVEAGVAAAMRLSFDDSKGTFESNKEWAERSGWELPVELTDTQYGACFCLTEDYCISVIECPVGRLDGRISDVLLALVNWLASESMKTPAHIAVEYSSLMGQDCTELLSHDEFRTMRSAPLGVFEAWVKGAAPGLYQELAYWDDDPEMITAALERLRELAIAFDDERSALRRVGAEKMTESAIKGLQALADGEEPSVYRSYALEVCDYLLKRPSVNALGECQKDARYEFSPGQSALIDTGLLDRGELEEQYQYLNEISMNNDEVGVLPLSLESDALIELLTHVTICERFLLRLASLIEDKADLSGRAEAGK